MTTNRAKAIETYRGFVYPWEMDHVGHMNVQFYVRRFDEASWHFLHALGVGPSYLKEENRGVVAMEQTVRYRREVLAGSLLAVRTRPLEVAPKVLRYVHAMENCETGEVVAEMELLVAQIDTRERRATPWPSDVVEKARRWLERAEDDSADG